VRPSGACHALRMQTERWVLISDKREGVGGDAGRPAHDAFDEIEDAAWVVTGDEDREPGDDDGADGADAEQGQDDLASAMKRSIAPRAMSGASERSVRAIGAARRGETPAAFARTGTCRSASAVSSAVWVLTSLLLRSCRMAGCRAGSGCSFGWSAVAMLFLGS